MRVCVCLCWVKAGKAISETSVLFLVSLKGAHLIMLSFLVMLLKASKIVYLSQYLLKQLLSLCVSCRFFVIINYNNYNDLLPVLSE